MSATALPDQLSDAARAFVSRGFGAAADGRTFDSVDPASGEVIATLPLGGRPEVDAAVAAAQAAFAQGSEWRRMLPGDRGRAIARLAELVEANADELAQIESLDNGKPVKFARHVDVAGAVAHFAYFAGWPTKIEG